MIILPEGYKNTISKGKSLGCFPSFLCAFCKVNFLVIHGAKSSAVILDFLHVIGTT